MSVIQPAYHRVRHPRPWNARGDCLMVMSDGATITLNVREADLFRVQIAGNRTLAAPRGAFDGHTFTLEIQQDSIGSRTLTLATGVGGFTFSTDAPLAAWQLSTDPNAIDIATFMYRAPSQRWLVLGLLRGF